MPELQMENHLVVPMTESKTIELIQELDDNKELSLLIKMIKDSWLEELTEVPDSLRKYWTFGMSLPFMIIYYIEVI